ncbi:MAG: histidine phosphatase family protein [Hyphomicrobiales bacterium]|nr:histidine phosphatase family protein [Hyphomicrobiales bacterium]
MVESTFNFGTTPFYFLRHGETHESRKGIVQGQNETELNSTGRNMAEIAAQALLNVSLGSIYASPLKRAWRTASIISVLTKVPAYTLPGLKERHWGEFQGRPKAHRPSTPGPGTVESEEGFRQRVTNAMESIEGPSPVLVVAHSGVFRAICESVGFRIDNRISVISGQVLWVAPPVGHRRNWRIRVVN